MQLTVPFILSFLYKDNPNDAVKIKLGLNDSDELVGDRRKLLEKIEINPSNDVDLLPASPYVSPELLGFLRVLNMNKGWLLIYSLFSLWHLTLCLIADQLGHWLASDKAADLCHLDCALDTGLEIKTWKYLEIRLTILLRSFPTTIADDEALLERPKQQMGHVKGLLTELRLNEKRILRDAIEYVQQRVKNWIMFCVTHCSGLISSTPERKDNIDALIIATAAMVLFSAFNVYVCR